MPYFTKTSDWLIDYYSQFSGMLISGHTSLSKKFDLSDEEEVSLLFATNRAKIFTYILTIIAKSKKHSQVKETLKKSQNVRNLVSNIQKVLNKKVHIILYDPTIEIFSVTEDFLSFNDFKSNALIDYFSKVDPEITQNPGTFKDINKSINDSFQIWKRKHFSKYMVFNDFDLMILSEPLIFELKRVQESIDTWNPYIDDSSNYGALLLICQLNRIGLRVLAYQAERKGIVALHDVFNVKNEFIQGRYLLCKPNDKVIKKGITNQKSTSYTSKRQHQKY